MLLAKVICCCLCPEIILKLIRAAMQSIATQKAFTQFMAIFTHRLLCHCFIRVTWWHIALSNDMTLKLIVQNVSNLITLSLYIIGVLGFWGAIRNCFWDVLRSVTYCYQ
jgi:hypothetical protein